MFFSTFEHYHMCITLPITNKSYLHCQNTDVQIVRKIPTHTRFWIVLCKNPYKQYIIIYIEISPTCNVVFQKNIQQAVLLNLLKD